jgi:UDP-N-acetylmuramoylalanine--D-glutamate ligase
VAECEGINYYNDSKGTNVGATLAALAGVPGERVVLIAGGQGKGQDFSPLRDVVAKRCRAVVLIGEDAALLRDTLHDCTDYTIAKSMGEAVAAAARLARYGDSVLLSPACASFDMFANYQQRGEAFVAAVGEVSP